MNFCYQKYVERYKYEPFSWPPDLGLSQLHARCSQPGPINEDGVECPCCNQKSKKKVHKWWKHNIDEDLKQTGTAIPGYFQLIKYYSFFVFLILIINSIYPIYATYYACNELDTSHDYCLEVGILYYLQFNSLIKLLKQSNKQNMVDILMILQTAVFYLLLIANYFSIIFITFLNDTAKRQLQIIKNSQASRCLVFYNAPQKIAMNMENLIKADGDQSMNIIQKMELYQIQKYYMNFQRRNKIFYFLLSLQVIAQNPLKLKNLNKQLQHHHHIVLEQKQKFHQYSGRVLVMFENIEARKLVYSTYHLGVIEKWWIGVRTLLNQFNIYKFDPSTIRFSTYEIGIGQDVIWQNLGEPLGLKMAIRIKTFFVAAFFILVCYVVLYYPMVFSLKAHIKQETAKYVRLNTFEKVLPNLTSFALVGISIYFRIYMDKLSEQRNPKNQLQRARFVLISCLTFHLLFYVIIPTLFFMVPGQISETVKLYVISEQARTFIVVQVVIVSVDLPFRIWKSKKVKALSDQRIAFRNNQQMLHKLVQCRDYPLQIRLQVLFRIWSLVLFYAFFIPYMTFYILVAFAVIFWVEKNNLYKHYTIRRKVSIKLESETLMYYVNFFCLYLCFVYCFSVRDNAIKVIIAVILTVSGLAVNILYWIVMNKADERSSQILLRNSQQLPKEEVLLKKQKLFQAAQQFTLSYHKFLQGIQNQSLDQQITRYLMKFREFQKQRDSRRMSQSIQLATLKQHIPENQNQKQQSENEMEHQNIQSDSHY